MQCTALCSPQVPTIVSLLSAKMSLSSCMECPECRVMVNVGCGGEANLQSHLGSTACRAQRKKKIGEQVITAQRACLANWLNPHPAATLAPVYALSAPQPLHPHSPVRPTPERAHPAKLLVHLSHLEKARALAKQLPSLVPEAKDGDIIYTLGAVDPESYVQTNCTDSPDED